jgi:hypothetical protein
VALHLVSGAGQRFSTWKHSSSSETVASVSLVEYQTTGTGRNTARS